MSTFTKIAILISFCWCLLTLGLGVSFHKSGSEVSELGGFIGGMASSLALLWLVLGYFQQQRELSLITRSLELQSIELQRTADEQGRLARNSSLRTGLLLSPFLALRLGKLDNRNGRPYREVWAQNIGAHAAYFNHKLDDIVLLRNEIEDNFWCTGDEHYFEVGVMGDEVGMLTITFYNRNGDLVVCVIRFDRGDRKLPKSARLILHRTHRNSRVADVGVVEIDEAMLQPSTVD